MDREDHADLAREHAQGGHRLVESGAVHQRRPVQGHQDVVAVEAEVLARPQGVERGQGGDERVDHRVPHEVDPRVREALARQVRGRVLAVDEEMSLSRSVSARLCSSGIDVSKLRSPDST